MNTPMTTLSLILTTAALTLAAACGDDTMGRNGGVDAGGDAGSDSGTDIGGDPGSDAASDSGPDRADADADAGDPRWACLGDVEPPNFTPGSATGTITVAAFPGNVPLGGITVKVCRFDDPTCDDPSDEGVTDESGVVTLDVTTAEPIVYELTGENLAPARFFRRGLAPDSDPFDLELGALTSATLEVFATAVGAEVDETRGHLVITGRDCQAALAAGLSFDVDTADSESTQVYLDDGLPSFERTQTDASGRGGVLNVPVGDVRVESNRAADGVYVGSREVYISAGWISYIGVVPSAE